MIYELKIRLRNTEFSAERVIQIEEETTFRQLHHIVQTVFDWYGAHAHIFSVKQSNQEDILIGNRKMNHQSFVKDSSDHKTMAVLDERKELVSEWFSSMGDHVIYRYNPNKDWVHTVELVDILEPEERIFYPRCVSATYLPPLENSHANHKKRKVKADLHSTEELLDIVNEALTRSLPIISSDSTEEDDAVYKRMLQLSRTYYEEKPWEQIKENQLFVLLDPKTEIKLFRSINGEQGNESGISIYIGEDSFASLLESSILFEETHDAVKAAHALTHIEALGLIYKQKEELDKEDLYLLNSHSVSFEGQIALPMFSSISPENPVPTQLDTEEARMMVLALEQSLDLLSQVKKGLEIPSIQDSSVLVARVYSPEYKQFVNNELKIITNHS